MPTPHLPCAPAALSYPLGEQLPESAATLPLLDGSIHWLRMPLPFALDHINLWCLPAADGGSQVDCGIGSQTIFALWQKLLTQNSTRGLWQKTRQLVATHYHPDHLGAAHFLCTRFDAPLLMSLGEYSTARLARLSAEGFSSASWHLLCMANGASDPSLIAAWKEQEDYYPRLVPQIPAHFCRLREGDTLRLGEHLWQVMSGYGHSPEHLSFFCAAEKVLIAGDMVLPRISSVMPL